METKINVLKEILDNINNQRKLQHDYNMINDYENERVESFLFHAVEILNNRNSKGFHLLNEYLINLENTTKKLS